MKKLLFIFPICLLIGLSGCSPKLTPTPRVIEEMYFDYAPFARTGFLISPDPYPSEFEACGEILIKVQPAKIIKKGKQVYDAVNGSYFSNDYLASEDIAPEIMLKMAVDNAKKVGANALVNFKCIAKYDSYYSTVLVSYVNILSHYEISGFAIKRK